MARLWGSLSLVLSERMLLSCMEQCLGGGVSSSAYSESADTMLCKSQCCLMLGNGILGIVQPPPPFSSAVLALLSLQRAGNMVHSFFMFTRIVKLGREWIYLVNNKQKALSGSRDKSVVCAAVFKNRF